MSCISKILPCLATLILLGCGAGASIQNEAPAMKRGVAQGVVVEDNRQFNALKKYGIFIADSREGTHVILPASKLFVQIVPDTILEPDFYVALNDLAKTLNAYPKVKIAVVGHTDDTMSDAMQGKISLHEARVVADYLTTAGVNPGRIWRIDGVGDREPIGDNTFIGRQLNRRVEVIVAAPLS